MSDFAYPFTRPDGYADTLVGAEYADMTTAELEAEADKRYVAWRAVIAAAQDAPPPSPVEVVQGALSDAQSVIDSLNGTADTALQQKLSGVKTVAAFKDVLATATQAMEQAHTAALGVVDTTDTNTSLGAGLADAVTGVTFEGLQSQLAVDPSQVHGLKKLTATMLKNLPFQLNSDQVAYTCLCGSGWLTITSDLAGAQEAFKAHIGEA